MTSTELELKLTLSQDALQRFRRRSILRRYAADRPKRRKLRSIYYDTPDFVLYRANISFRVRRDGGKWLQTVKCGTGIQHGLSNPIEVESYVHSARPDLDRISDQGLRKQLIELLSGQCLQPAFETSIWRTSRSIEVPGEGTVELALDQGEVHAGDRTNEIREIEIELKSGRPHALLSAAEAFFSQDPITVSQCSKAEQGYRLLSATPCSKTKLLKPNKGRKPVLEEQMSRGEALSEIGGAASDQILDNWQATLVLPDPEGPHQLRVGLRRLRTAIRLLVPKTQPVDLLSLAREARDLAQIVGKLRDADVLISDIYEPAAKSVFGDDGTIELSDVLIGHQENQRKLVRADLASARWSNLKLNCIFFEQAVERSIGLAGAEENGSIVSIGRCALKKCWRRVRKQGRRLENLSIHERHEMRKDLKSLRYATEFFLPLYASGQTREFLKQLKRLQDVFGYLNDVAMAEQLSGIVEVASPGRADLQRSVKRLRDWHEARAEDAWHDAQQRWRNLADTPRFWR